ncbi:thiol oxidoreductase [Spongiibacter sp. KMU-158]|uniref:Thiol oxidoreductase n=1 Tax=Spongiibacter pelagi TaxID=2760804 RepID=A0A927GWX7_9GAMM|nr:di-heme oxidoredictase family protein [Spongiibacter pelagi]MBD2860221.1 thiol oxidoreductase [Spongiibacter pelagi]
MIFRAVLVVALILLASCERLPDYTSAEDGEQFAGGETTFSALNPLEYQSRDAYSQPASNLSLAERQLFSVGNSFFTQPWVSAPSSVSARDGLGPLYNAAACQDCHLRDGRGLPATMTGATSSLVKIAVDGKQPDPHYGDQLQTRALLGITPEAKLTVSWSVTPYILPDGEKHLLRRPEIHLSELAYGELSKTAALGLRVAPPMIGLGLLENISADEIKASADPEDRDGDGISGRINTVIDLASQQQALGRFGWKAAQPSVHQQTLVALANDMGITSAIIPQSTCTPAQNTACAKAYSDSEPELEAPIEKALVFYASHLAVPMRRWYNTEEVLQGKRLFHQFGCAACHRPSWTTVNSSENPALSQQKIWPYTDLLLHDMGDELADGISEFSASGSEWRTPPLWGIHLSQSVSGKHSGFLHDGRARTFEEAILWHGGEAQAARDAWANAPKAQREFLIWFLKTL